MSQEISSNDKLKCHICSILCSSTRKRTTHEIGAPEQRRTNRSWIKAIKYEHR